MGYFITDELLPDRGEEVEEILYKADCQVTDILIEKGMAGQAPDQETYKQIRDCFPSEERYDHHAQWWIGLLQETSHLVGIGLLPPTMRPERWEEVPEALTRYQECNDA